MPPKWKMDAKDPQLTPGDRKSIIKSQKCRLQREKAANEKKAKDDKILELSRKVAALQVKNGELVLENELLRANSVTLVFPVCSVCGNRQLSDS